MKLSRRLYSIVVLTTSLVLCVVSASAQQTSSLRSITAEDYYAFEFAGDPNISPDGKLVAYVVTKVDRVQNRRNSSIWMAAVDQSRELVQVQCLHRLPVRRA